MVRRLLLKATPKARNVLALIAVPVDFAAWTESGERVGAFDARRSLSGGLVEVDLVKDGLTGTYPLV